MREFCKSGSVRGAVSDDCPYRDTASMPWWSVNSNKILRVVICFSSLTNEETG